jgi:Na+-transporting NADH:ubiquinone oxidoreductase subunit A
MSVSVKLKKGFDLRMKGIAEKKMVEVADPVLYAVKPTDFPGLTPKMEVKPGEKIQAGTTLFVDKLHPEIRFTSPVSGTVVAVNRGDRRKLLEVVVEKSGDDFIDFGKQDLSTLSAEKVKELLLASGLWPAVRQRPYHIIASPASVPKSIFVSGFDTAPLAPDYNFIAENSDAFLFQSGITALKKLTEGKVNLIFNGKTETPVNFKNIAGAEISRFSGPHPAGNVGVQIHHLDPLNKGEVVWIVNFQDVMAIGRLFAEGIYKNERIVALTGSEMIAPHYCKMRAGAAIDGILKEKVKIGHQRYISGNVLTGTNIGEQGFLGYYDAQITVIPEGDYYEFFGWAMPGFDKLSFYQAFFASLLPKRNYTLNTNLHGGERAFVLTGKYEKVVPMDIYPMQLLKAILAQDLEMMENLGIYEIAEEDFALCEYICPSKIEIQAIVRQGIELMIKEMN